MKGKLFFLLFILLLMPQLVFASELERNCPSFSIFDPLDSIRCSIEKTILDIMEGLYSHIIDIFHDLTTIQYTANDINNSYIFQLVQDLTYITLIALAIYYILKLIITLDVKTKALAKNTLINIFFAFILIKFAPALGSLIIDLANSLNYILEDAMIQIIIPEIDLSVLYGLEGTLQIAVFLVYTVLFVTLGFVVTIMLFLDTLAITLLLSLLPFIIGCWNISKLKLSARFMGYMLIALIILPLMIKIIFLIATWFASGLGVGKTIGLILAFILSLIAHTIIIVMVFFMSFIDVIKGIIKLFTGTATGNPIVVMEGLNQTINSQTRLGK